MPFISHNQMQRVHHVLHKGNEYKARAMAHAKEKKKQAIAAAEAVGAGVIAGYARGKMEDASGQWLVPSTTLDVEMTIGGGLVLAGMFNALGEYSDDAIHAGVGVLSHYFGQAARNYAKSGTLSWPLVAGRQGAPILGGPIVGGDADLAQALSALSPR